MKFAPLMCRFILPTDDPEVVFIKKLVMTMVSLAAIFTSLSYAGTGSTVLQSVRAVLITFSVALGLQVVIEKRVRSGLLEAYFYFLGLLLCLGDLVAVSRMSQRSWPFFIIVMDACLVCRLPSRVATSLFALLLIWFSFATMESTFRFGLFDLGFLTSQEERFESVNCTELPCKLSFALSFQSYGGSLMVCVVDFYFTRGFASSIRKERDKMNRVIAAAEQISTSLSRFDLASAESVLNATSLPDPLSDSFNCILKNLYVYRPYLPQSCLHGEDFTDSSGTERKEEEHVHSSFSSMEITSPMSPMSPNYSNGKSSVDVMKLLERKRCTFTVANMLGSHREAARDITAYQERYKGFMEEVVSCCSLESGVVGVVIGDHVHSSFNAVRKCGSHASGAVQGAVCLYIRARERGIEVVTGVASGTAFCGPLGCADLMSVGMIGPSSLVASMMQDFGRVRGLKVVCSGSVYNEVSYAFTMRIILGRVVVAGQKVAELGYEVLMNDHDKEKVKVEEEWMYQLEERPWETYNTAGKQYLLGESDEALRVLRIERVKSDEVLAAETDLLEAIAKGLKGITTPVRKCTILGGRGGDWDREISFTDVESEI